MKNVRLCFRRHYGFEPQQSKITSKEFLWLYCPALDLPEGRVEPNYLQEHLWTFIIYFPNTPWSLPCSWLLGIQDQTWYCFTLRGVHIWNLKRKIRPSKKQHSSQESERHRRKLRLTPEFSLATGTLLGLRQRTVLATYSLRLIWVSHQGRKRAPHKRAT